MIIFLHKVGNLTVDIFISLIEFTIQLFFMLLCLDFIVNVVLEKLLFA